MEDIERKMILGDTTWILDLGKNFNQKLKSEHKEMLDNIDAYIESEKMFLKTISDKREYINTLSEYDEVYYDEINNLTKIIQNYFRLITKHFHNNNLDDN